MGRVGNFFVDNWSKIVGVLVVLIVVSLISLGIWYIFWVTFVDNYEFGFSYDKFTGQIHPLEHTGWVIANPFHYSIHAIDTRPYQVSITANLSTANQRILNAKLVSFNPAGLATFIAWHGRASGDKVEELKEILKCYAFDREEGRDCPFLTVVSVLAPSQSMPQNPEVK